MRCSKCGWEIHDSAKFCPQCGNALETDTKSHSSEKQSEEQEDSKGGGCGIIFGFLIVFVLAIGICVYAGYANYAKKSGQSASIGDFAKTVDGAVSNKTYLSANNAGTYLELDLSGSPSGASVKVTSLTAGYRKYDYVVNITQKQSSYTFYNATLEVEIEFEYEIVTGSFSSQHTKMSKTESVTIKLNSNGRGTATGTLDFGGVNDSEVYMYAKVVKASGYVQ